MLRICGILLQHDCEWYIAPYGDQLSREVRKNLSLSINSGFQPIQVYVTDKMVCCTSVGKYWMNEHLEKNLFFVLAGIGEGLFNIRWRDPQVLKVFFTVFEICSLKKADDIPRYLAFLDQTMGALLIEVKACLLFLPSQKIPRLFRLIYGGYATF